LLRTWTAVSNCEGIIEPSGMMANTRIKWTDKIATNSSRSAIAGMIFGTDLEVNFTQSISNGKVTVFKLHYIVALVKSEYSKSNPNFANDVG